jgi:hypothetical protein
MAVVTKNIQVPCGDTYEETWTVKQEDGTTPYDLTGCLLIFTIKNASVLTGTAQADPGVLQLKTPASGIVLTNASGGIATMTMTATQTNGISPQTYVYDVRLKDASGKIKRLQQGTVEFLPAITTSTS